jgi:hypothetical protein
MLALSDFIDRHPYFSVFLVFAAIAMVGVFAEGLKGRNPKCCGCHHAKSGGEGSL